MDKFMVNPRPGMARLLYDNWEAACYAEIIIKDGSSVSNLSQLTEGVICVALRDEKGRGLQLSGPALEKSWTITKDFLRSYPNIIFQKDIFNRNHPCKEYDHAIEPLQWD